MTFAVRPRSVGDLKGGIEDATDEPKERRCLIS